MLLTACGGGGPDRKSMDGTEPSQKDEVNTSGNMQASQAFVLAPPVAVPGTHRVRLRWAGAPAGSGVSVWLADDMQRFRTIATRLAGQAAEVDLGAVWKLDWPSARLRLRACVGNPSACVDSNTRPLVDALAAGVAKVDPPQQRLASVFSSRVALSADGNTLAVADPLDFAPTQPRPPGTGSIQVYRRTQGGWQREAYLANFDVDGNFGDPMALSGDGRTLMVGAYTDGGMAGGINPPVAGGSDNWTGAVYVFVREAGPAWRRQAFLKAAQPALGETFGYRLATSHDGNRLVVGGTRHRLHVFVREAGTWRQEGLIQELPNEAELLANQALALSGDGRRIACTASIASAPATQARPRAVRVYAYHTGSVWTRSGDLRSGKPPPANAPFDPHADAFGSALSFDHAGTILAVGAPGDHGDANDTGNDPGNLRAPDAGAVYIFGATGSTWQRRAFLKARNAVARDQFGADLAFSADGRVLLGKACGYSGNAAGVRRNHRDGTAARHQGDGCVWGGSAYLLTQDDAGRWRHASSVVPVGSDLVSYEFFSLALSADASTFALGTSIQHLQEGSQENRVFVY